MNSFTYDYPVRNYFGEGAMDQALDAEMGAMGKTVMLAYGGGSGKRTGSYGHVVDKFTSAGKRVVDFGGSMPNPTYEKCQEGAALAREEQVDFILAVGGGSVFDCCKVVSAQALLDEDIETFAHADGKMPSSFIPMGCIVTLSGTGAEQNNGAVITNEETHVKGAYLGAMPMWAALDPALTLTVPHTQFMSGAFDTLGEDIAKRMNRGVIGFADSAAETGGSDDPSDFLRFAKTSDFIKYGFEAEFIGRLPVRVACEPLKADDLADILVSSEGSILRQYESDFRGYGIDFSVTKEAVEAVARLAYEEKTGARGLMTVLERTLRDFKFDLPSSGIRHFELDSPTVEDPKAGLERLLTANASLLRGELSGSLDEFAEKFRAENGCKLDFDAGAREKIISLCVARDTTARALSADHFRGYAHGEAKDSRDTGGEEFPITKEAVENPDKYLSDLVVNSFKK